MHPATASDERHILNQLGEFARILDTRNWDRVGEVFADDISFNYGDGREQQGIAALTDTFRTFLEPCGPSQHLLGSIQLTIEGDSACTRSYVQARHQGKGERQHLFLDSNGEYTDRWRRTAAGWRISRRDVQWFMLQGDMSVLREIRGQFT